MSLSLALALSAGCATSGPAAAPPAPAAPAEKKVAVGRGLPHFACRELGPIKGAARGGDWAAADPKEQDTYGQLTSSTLRLNGDFALIDAVAKAERSVTVTGRAYDCSQPPPPGATPPAAAAPPSGPQWPPPEMVASSGAPAAPVKKVNVGRLLPHTACRDLGSIMGTGGGGAFTNSESKMQDAYDQLGGATRSLGGDFALIDAVGSDARGITVTGHAYDCSKPPPAEAASKPADSVEARLNRLDQLKAKGLITPEEHATKRRAILDEL